MKTTSSGLNIDLDEEIKSAARINKHTIKCLKKISNLNWDYTFRSDKDTKIQNLLFKNRILSFVTNDPEIHDLIKHDLLSIETITTGSLRLQNIMGSSSYQNTGDIIQSIYYVEFDLEGRNEEGIINRDEIEEIYTLLDNLASAATFTKEISEGASINKQISEWVRELGGPCFEYVDVMELYANEID